MDNEGRLAAPVSLAKEHAEWAENRKEEGTVESGAGGDESESESESEEDN